MSQLGRNIHQSDRKKNAKTKSKLKTPQERARACARISDVFGDQFDADVINLILEECDWEENEATEKLFQLCGDERASTAKSECIGLDIIACKLLEDSAVSQDDAGDFNPTDSSTSGGQHEESSTTHFRTGDTSGLTYNYEEFARVLSLPLPGVSVDESGLCENVSLSSHTQSVLSGQWDSLDNGFDKDNQIVSSQTSLSAASSKVSPVTDSKFCSGPKQPSTLENMNHKTKPLGRECISSSSQVNSLYDHSEQKLGVALSQSDGGAVAAPVQSESGANSFTTGNFATKLVGSTCTESGKNSTAFGKVSEGLSAKAAEFVPSFVLTQRAASSGLPGVPLFYLPDCSVSNRPVRPVMAQTTGHQNGQFSATYLPGYPTTHIDMRPQYQVPTMPVSSFQPVANTGNVTFNRLIGHNLYRPTFPASHSAPGSSSSKVGYASPASYSASAAAASQTQPTAAAQNSAATSSARQSAPRMVKRATAVPQSGGSNSAASNSQNSLVEKIKQYSWARLLIIMRGLPGSGKSYLARKLQGSGQVFSTDEFFMRGDVYDFCPEKLSEAHEWNRKRVKKALEDGVTPVIVDNTNTEVWEMLPYAELALARGYMIEIVEPGNPWSFQPKQLAKMNTHSVSIESIKRMKDRYQTIDTAALVRQVKRKLEGRTLPQESGPVKRSSSAPQVDGEDDLSHRADEKKPIMNQPSQEQGNQSLWEGEIVKNQGKNS